MNEAITRYVKEPMFKMNASGHVFPTATADWQPPMWGDELSVSVLLCWLENVVLHGTEMPVERIFFSLLTGSDTSGFKAGSLNSFHLLDSAKRLSCSAVVNNSFDKK